MYRSVIKILTMLLSMAIIASMLILITDFHERSQSL